MWWNKPKKQPSFQFPHMLYSLCIAGYLGYSRIEINCLNQKYVFCIFSLFQITLIWTNTAYDSKFSTFETFLLSEFFSISQQYKYANIFKLCFGCVIQNIKYQ